MPPTKDAADPARAAVPATNAADPTKDRDELRVMPWWSVLLGLLAAVLLGWLVLGWLFGEADRAGQPDTRAQLRIDAIRTGLTVVAGTGGGVALLLAARRQWINERAQRHQEIVAAHERAHEERVQTHTEALADREQQRQERQAQAAEHDATERRVTELYTKAVDLLGSPNAAVRLGGLYALERLAQDNDRHRPTIAAVLCAYLRMSGAAGDPQEAEIRRSAQRLLTRHLKADDEATHWPGVGLELAGAHLADFDASGCTLDDADFSGTVFSGQTSFNRATVSGHLRMAGAQFDTATFDGLAGDGVVVLDDARCGGEASFRGARFGGRLSCLRARFDAVSFGEARFVRTANFDGSRFGRRASFREAVFEAGLSIEHAEFAGYAGFRNARFDDMVLLRWTVFGQDTLFENAVFRGRLSLARAQFHGSVSFDGAALDRAPLVDHARASATAAHTWPPGTKITRLDDEWLVLTDT
ncbi:MAG: hypothetical protein V7603_6797 [Micromonosporaceae bacterium]